MLCILYRLTDSESPQPKIGRYKVDTYIMLLIKIKRSKNEDEIVHKIPAVFSQETDFFAVGMYIKKTCFNYFCHHGHHYDVKFLFCKYLVNKLTGVSTHQDFPHPAI